MGIYIRDLFQAYRKTLEAVYPTQEAENLALWLLGHFLKVKRKDLLANEWLENLPKELTDAMEKLKKGVPIQYVLKLAPFYGREFFVNPSVLIPRNETEELVHLIIHSHTRQGLRIMDVGTGSGCIPITLALELPRAELFALDVSKDALAVAKKNAAKMAAKVNFYQGDILSGTFPEKDLDIIVSNPPYVREAEKEQMHRNVLEHEPALALFVPDGNPLLFYTAIAKKSRQVLRKGGFLYLEINEAFGEEVRGLLEDCGYTEVRVYRDLNGKDRMVCGRIPLQSYPNSKKKYS